MKRTYCILEYSILQQLIKMRKKHPFSDLSQMTREERIIWANGQMAIGKLTKKLGDLRTQKGE